MTDNNLDEISRIWTEELTIAGKQMAVSLITGLDPPNIDISVSMQVPKPLYQAVTNACQKTGIAYQEVFNQMASAGFKKSMADRMQAQPEQKPVQQQPLPAGTGLDMNNITDQLQKMQALMSQVAGLQEVVGNVQTTIERANFDAKTPKNP
jgi:hypothetical protein